jgi:hypothetical protein
MLVMFQTMSFQKSLWQLLVIYVMILMGKWTFFCSSSRTINKFSIHPRYKQDVGYRLSRSGLAVGYGQQVEFQGPIVQNVAYTTGGATVSITYTAVSGLDQRSAAGFEVCLLVFQKKNVCFLCRLVVKELNARMMVYGFQHLSQAKVIWP